MAKTVQSDDGGMATFRGRLPRIDVEKARVMARRESVRRGEDVTWADILRAGLRNMLKKVT